MMHNPGDEIEGQDQAPSESSDQVEAPTEALKPITLPEDLAAEAPTELMSSPPEDEGAEITQLPPPVVVPQPAPPSPETPLSIPVDRQNLAQEFWGFIVYNKAWWMTPIVLVLALMVAFILFAETSPVLPFIYTVI
jgi:hypothetical protein